MRDSARVRPPPPAHISRRDAAHGTASAAPAGAIRVPFPNLSRSNDMQWNDPAFCDIRLGFEVTAYVYVR